ncbi:MAG: hypothetical protein J7K02_06750 [Deltaproteobacteria bacterium]|nr:hypothetical protein [Deltaproteobacteria bacterium]
MSHKKDEIISLLKDFFQVRVDSYQIDMAFLYGSQAGGYPRGDSDVDVAVLFLPNQENEDVIFKRVTEISLSLSGILGKDVNLLVLDRDFKRPMLQYNAIVLGIPVFIRGFDSYIGLYLEALYQMEDFSLFGIEWQLTISERRLKGDFNG